MLELIRSTIDPTNNFPLHSWYVLAAMKSKVIGIAILVPLVVRSLGQDVMRHRGGRGRGGRGRGGRGKGKDRVEQASSAKVKLIIPLPNRPYRPHRRRKHNQ